MTTRAKKGKKGNYEGLEAHHFMFICKKLGEGLMSYTLIADLFNKMYNRGDKPISILRHTVMQVSKDNIYTATIKEYKTAFNKSIEENKYSKQSVLLSIAGENLEVAREFSKPIETSKIVESVAKLAGICLDKQEIKNDMNITLTSKEIQDHIKKVLDDEKIWLDDGK